MASVIDFCDSKKTTTHDEFKLERSFLDKFRDQKPKFGYNGLGEFVFYRTYSRNKPDGTKESFFDTITRVVQGCYEIQRRHCERLHTPWSYKKAQASAQEMFQRMWDFKFLPPGRGLWAMGTPFMWQKGSAALNNCFPSSEEIITRDGIKPIGDLVGTTQELLTTNGEWINAPIRSFGKQRLMKIVLERFKSRKIIYATPDHRWFARQALNRVPAGAIGKNRIKLMKPIGAFEELLTKDLQPGYELQTVYGQGVQDIRPSQFGIAHGICFGDGTLGHKDKSTGSYLYLCGKKNFELLKFFSESPTSFDARKCTDGAIRVADLPRGFKLPPDLRESKSYLYGFLAGYLAADGTVSKKMSTACISSSKEENILLVRDICAILGIATSLVFNGTQIINHRGERKEFIGYRIYLKMEHLTEDFFLLSHHKERYLEWINRGRHSHNFKWIIKSVEMTDREEEVFCATVPGKRCFALADNILTGNCGYISTEDIDKDPTEPFSFMMDMSMLGVGIGFDTKGAGKLRINTPSDKTFMHIIDDSREGWVESLCALISSYTKLSHFGRVEFDYSKIRPAGSPIKGFGGVASGPDLVRDLHVMMAGKLDAIAARDWPYLTSVDITDLMNFIGKCVVAGNVRRTAQIAFGESDDDLYRNLKNPMYGLSDRERAVMDEITYQIYAQNRQAATKEDVNLANPESLDGTDIGKLQSALETWNSVVSHRWASNNSIYAKVGMNYEDTAASIAVNGEPGLLWLDNIQNYGRMKDGRQQGIDRRAKGSNPCFSGKMRLLTDNGYTTIYDLWLASGAMEYDGLDVDPLAQYGIQRVVNRDGVVDATKIYRTSINTDLYRVVFSDNSIIEATANHKFIVLDRISTKKSGTKYVERRVNLSELQIDDLIPLNQTVHFGTFHDPAYAELAGWCIGDGSLSPKADGQVRAECTCYDADTFDALPHLRGLLLEVYESHNKSSHQQPMYAGWSRNQDHFDHDETRVGSNVLGRLLRNDGVVSGDKHNVPSSIWSGTKQTVAAFIRGLASADGFILISDNGTISARINQSNEPFLQQCRLLLNQFGIASTVQLRRRKSKQYMNDGKGGKKLYNKKANYELIISGIKQVSRFLNDIGFIQDWKMASARKWLSTHHGSNNSDTGRYVRVKSIEYCGKGDTYCLTEPKNNQVVIEGIQIGQCVEQSLESHELCCLVESFPANHTDVEDYHRTLKFAYLYAKSVTLLPTHCKLTNQVLLRNRRIGLSQTGIVQAFTKFGRRTVLSEFCDKGYKVIRHWDNIYSEWLAVPKSIKVTSVKPSGSVSLLAGATAGIHYTIAPSRSYWRRVRISSTHPLVKIAKDAGYHVEQVATDKYTSVITFGINEQSTKTVGEVSIWEQMKNAVDYQYYWADNQVSVTIQFKESEASQIVPLLASFDDQLKGVSFLPLVNHGYAQAPYEAATPEEIEMYNSKIKQLDFTSYLQDGEGTKFCDGDACTI